MRVHQRQDTSLQRVTERVNGLTSFKGGGEEPERDPGIAGRLSRVEACVNIPSRMGAWKGIDGLTDGSAIRIVWGRSASGRYEGEEFYLELDERQKSKFFALFELVGERGTIRNEKSFRYPMKNCGNLGEFKIFKKRLFFFRSGDHYVITHGATKKKDATDPSDIERAERIKSEIELEERQGRLTQTPTYKKGENR